jgi:hypothetical protein
MPKEAIITTGGCNVTGRDKDDLIKKKRKKIIRGICAICGR